MNAIGSILRSYFQRRLMVLWMMAPVAFMLLIAHIVIPSKPGAAWCFFLYSLTCAAGMTGFHLRQMLESDSIDLLPKHRGRQLIAAGIILAVLLTWPLLLTALRSGPILTTLAVYLFFAFLGLGVSFFSSRAGGISAIIGIPIIGWLLYDIYGLVVVSPELSRIAALQRFAGPFWPAYVTAVSLLGLALFVAFYLKTPYASFSDELNADYLQCLVTQDWIGPVAVKRAENAIARISSTKGGTAPTLFRAARLFQFSLFSPVYSVRFYGFAALLFCLLYTYLSYHQKTNFSGPATNFYLPFAYFVFASVLAADFLAHRNRLSQLYLQSDLPTRHAFLRTTVLAYLLVVSKQMLGITLMSVLIHIAFSWTTWTNFIPLCAIGLVLSFIQVSLSLLAGKWMKSVNGFAWLLGNSLSALFIIPLSRFYSGSWTAVFVIAALSGIMFWMAFRNWLETELDFVTN